MTDKKKISFIFAVGCLTLLIVRISFAADQGTVGTVSQGRVDINLAIPDLIRISDLNDFSLGTYSGSGEINANDNICVWRNRASAQYKITATATEGAFKIKSGANKLAYSVFYNDQIGTSGEIAVSYNTATATQTGANTQSSSCAVGGLVGNVHIKILEASLQRAQPGAYIGTLILTAEPI